jgi:bifunctional non-homologous end joining protein LigD
MKKALPLEERKRRLETLVGSRARVIRYTPHFDADGRTVLAHACRLGAEGSVSKCRTAPYRPGSRSDDWRKTKCVRRQEFVVGGFTEPEGSRDGVGSILVGYYEGDSLRFAGKVGTGRGWNDAFGRQLRGLLESIEVSASRFDPPPPGALAKRAHWVEPHLVAEVQFTEWTGGGKIRHPSLQGFRADKRPADVRRERESNQAN